MAAAHAEHLGDRRAGDVGVENADFVAGARQFDGEGTGDEGLAHAALAR